MQSSGAEPWNFRVYRAQLSPCVGSPGCPTYFLLGLFPLGWSLRA